MKDNKGDKARLMHILDAISEIESYTINATEEIFLANSMMRFATIKQLEIIGEAANHITEQSQQLFNNLELRKLVGLRNILVHEYWGIDAETIFKIISIDLLITKNEVERVLQLIL
jgi:uncharacterized protein with HEPN domain